MIFIKDKLNYGQVKAYIEAAGYKLVSKNYTNAHTNLQMECSNGHSISMNYNNFKYNSRRCPVCAGKSKHDLETVIQLFAQAGYKVTDKIYLNNKTPVDCICPEGHSIKISVNNFKSGRRCRICSNMNKNDKVALRKMLSRKADQYFKGSEDNVGSSGKQVDNDLTIAMNEFTDELVLKLDQMKKNLGKQKVKYKKSEA